MTVTDWHDLRDSVTSDNRLYVVLLSVFSGFALLAAVLVIANAIAGRVLAQFRAIGLLKAIGFTPGGVLALYLGEHLALGLVAGAVGLVIGAQIAPVFQNELATSADDDAGVAVRAGADAGRAARHRGGGRAGDDRAGGARGAGVDGAGDHRRVRADAPARVAAGARFGPAAVAGGGDAGVEGRLRAAGAGMGDGRVAGADGGDAGRLARARADAGRRPRSPRALGDAVQPCGRLRHDGGVRSPLPASF